jgi:hypothetical protein
LPSFGCLAIVVVNVILLTLPLSSLGVECCLSLQP